MKDYPRIHSIGTINIIHHQNFDYELHPFRTDFTGDSGVGKSILTDLLQLIIIGSTEYESSTNSQDDRPFNTLVIETSEKGDYGYAYINIEVEKEEYLLIGCYIERNSKQSQAFIVQSGLDFDQNTFESFQKPFTVDDFVQDGTLLTLVDFDAKLNHSDHFGCHIYQYFRDYHEALLNNNLLPIDIANSKSALKDYAKILQAFSRKGISVKGDVKLQEFLFGKERNQVFYNKYLDTVKQFEDSVAMHRTNKKDIDILIKSQFTFIWSFAHIIPHKNHKKYRLRKRFIVHAFKYLLLNRQFMGYTVCAFLSYGGFFSWFTIGPVLIIHTLKYSAVAFGWITFVSGAVAIGSAGFLNARLVSRFSAITLLMFGWRSMLAAGMLMFILKWFIPLNLYIIAVPAFIFYFGSAFIWPNLFTSAFNSVGKIAGYAGSLYGLMQIGGGAAFSALASFLPAHTQLPLALLFIISPLSAYGVFKTAIACKGAAYE